MPPYSMLRMSCMCSSDFDAVQRSAQSAMPSTTWSACLLPASWYMSNMPAMILWMV